MSTYRAPLRDMHFVLHELPGFASVRKLPGCEDLSADLVAPILDGAAKLCSETLRPLNRSGDEEGCALENGVVRTARGLADAFRVYADGGWASVSSPQEFGGQHLPHAIRALFEEMICSANLAFASYTMLIPGACAALHAYASEPVRQRYLPKLIAGRWSATMCLTEAQSGSDLGLVRSSASPVSDGSYRITGTKIFVSAGEHDFTENIVHLVLARLPGAPAGTKGISLFVVPKLLPDSVGRPATRNRLLCTALEEKMGQQAAATCSIDFDGATGWLVGEPHRGLHAMFAMMNTARLGAGMQGLGIAEAAYQDAVRYARERLQGRALSTNRRTGAPADPIIAHPDVRRMLLTMRAYVEGMRALGQGVAQEIDRHERHPDAEVRNEAGEFLALMTPVVKAMFSDLGSECANLGLQVFGGHGYIRANGMEQYVRDVRITQIYDGTNGIQALDLVRRKLDGGRLAQRFIAPTRGFLQVAASEPGMSEFVQPTAAALARLEQVTAWIAGADRADPEEAAAAATEYLRQFGLVAIAGMWTRMAAVALPLAEGPEASFYRAKLRTARFYLQHLLPQAEGLAQSILAGGRALREFDAAAF